LPPAGDQLTIAELLAWIRSPARCGQKLSSEPSPAGYRKRHREPCAAFGTTERLLPRVQESPLVEQMQRRPVARHHCGDGEASAAPPALPDYLGRMRIEKERGKLSSRPSVNGGRRGGPDLVVGLWCLGCMTGTGDRRAGSVGAM
jgi:hypothetical protein